MERRSGFSPVISRMIYMHPRGSIGGALKSWFIWVNPLFAEPISVSSPPGLF